MDVLNVLPYDQGMNATRQRTVAILGASGGIGSAVARRLAQSGYRVALGGRDLKKLEQLAAETGGEPSRVEGTEFESVERFVISAAGDGKLAGVVNCAGSILLKPAHITTYQEYQDTLGANLTTAFAVVRAAAKALRADGGSVVLFSSAAAKVGLPNHEAIAAAKAGVSGLVLSAAATYARSSIRFNAIAPGLVDTPLTRRITSNERALESSLALHAVRRPGEPEEIANLVEWLLGTSSSWMTGQTLSLDGGLADIKSN